MNSAAQPALPEIAKTSLFRRWLQRFGPFFALLLVIAIFAAISDTPSRFLSPANLRIVLAQTVIVAIGAIGMTIIIISGGIDLSPGSTIALTESSALWHCAPVGRHFRRCCRA